MLKVEEKDGSLCFEGNIDQDTNFKELIKQVGNPCVLNLEKVSKINSTGVKQWIMFWEDKMKSGVKLIYKNCSPAIVEQLNMVKAFSCGGVVESFQAPFICGACEHEWAAQFLTSQITNGFPKQVCPSCKSAETELDELEDEYLSFLKKS